MVSLGYVTLPIDVIATPTTAITICKHTIYYLNKKTSSTISFREEIKSALLHDQYLYLVVVAEDANSAARESSVVRLDMTDLGEKVVIFRDKSIRKMSVHGNLMYLVIGTTRIVVIRMLTNHVVGRQFTESAIIDIDGDVLLLNSGLFRIDETSIIPISGSIHGDIVKVSDTMFVVARRDKVVIYNGRLKSRGYCIKLSGRIVKMFCGRFLYCLCDVGNHKELHFIKGNKVMFIMPCLDYHVCAVNSVLLKHISLMDHLFDSDAKISYNQVLNDTALNSAPNSDVVFIHVISNSMIVLYGSRLFTLFRPCDKIFRIGDSVFRCTEGKISVGSVDVISGIDPSACTMVRINGSVYLSTGTKFFELIGRDLKLIFSSEKTVHFQFKGNGLGSSKIICHLTKKGRGYTYDIAEKKFGETIKCDKAIESGYRFVLHNKRLTVCNIEINNVDDFFILKGTLVVIDRKRIVLYKVSDVCAENNEMLGKTILEIEENIKKSEIDSSDMKDEGLKAHNDDVADASNSNGEKEPPFPRDINEANPKLSEDHAPENIPGKSPHDEPNVSNAVDSYRKSNVDKHPTVTKPLLQTPSFLRELNDGDGILSASGHKENGGEVPTSNSKNVSGAPLQTYDGDVVDSNMIIARVKNFENTSGHDLRVELIGDFPIDIRSYCAGPTSLFVTDGHLLYVINDKVTIHNIRCDHVYMYFDDLPYIVLKNGYQFSVYTEDELVFYRHRICNLSHDDFTYEIVKKRRETISDLEDEIERLNASSNEYYRSARSVKEKARRKWWII